MQKTKSYDLQVQKMMEETPTKQPQTIIDWMFGINNAFRFYEDSRDIHFQFSWKEGDAPHESRGVANGEQIMDVVIGLITKYGWQEMDIVLHAEFTWDDAKAEGTQ